MLGRLTSSVTPSQVPWSTVPTPTSSRPPRFDRRSKLTPSLLFTLCVHPPSLPQMVRCPLLKAPTLLSSLEFSFQQNFHLDANKVSTPYSTHSSCLFSPPVVGVVSSSRSIHITDTTVSTLLNFYYSYYFLQFFRIQTPLPRVQTEFKFNNIISPVDRSVLLLKQYVMKI